MKYKALGEICEVVSGGTPSRSKFEYWNDGTIPWIKIGNIKSKYVIEADEYITRAGLDRSSAKMLPKGAILYTIFATLGEVGILNIEACTNQAIAGIVIKDKNVILTDFLYYYLKSKKSYVNNIGRGVAQNNINMSMLRSFQVPLPRIEEQQHIIDVLDTIGAIISARQQELQKLDVLVKSRFIEMFGDPVENEKGWETRKLNDVCPVNKYKGSVENVDGKVWLLNLDMVESSTGRVIDHLYEDEDKVNSSTIIFDTNCVLFSKLRPYLNKVVVPDKSGYATSEMISMNTANVNRHFLATLLRTNSFVSFANATAYGAKMPRASVDGVKNFDLIMPSKQLQDEFGTMAEQIDKSKFIAQKALKEAQLLFDSLMQKYFG